MKISGAFAVLAAVSACSGTATTTSESSVPSVRRAVFAEHVDHFYNRSPHAVDDRHCRHRVVAGWRGPVQPATRLAGGVAGRRSDDHYHDASDCEFSWACSLQRRGVHDKAARCRNTRCRRAGVSSDVPFCGESSLLCGSTDGADRRVISRFHRSKADGPSDSVHRRSTPPHRGCLAVGDLSPRRQRILASRK